MRTINFSLHTIYNVVDQCAVPAFSTYLFIASDSDVRQCFVPMLQFVQLP